MKDVPSYVKYNVYFDLLEEDIFRIQNEKNSELGYEYYCIYYFIEKTHAERVQIINEDGIPLIKIIDYFSLIVITSRYPLQKKHIVAILDVIPNGETRKGKI